MHTKETTLGSHQTGHNSGVIHAGIYYKPGSLKAELCRQGAAATKAFCNQYDIPFETRGKLVVATNADEIVRMHKLYENACRNGIAVEKIDANELRRREPAITGLGALFVPQSGIVDYRHICRVMGELIVKAGGLIEHEANVGRIDEAGDSVTVRAGHRGWRARQLIACGGLQSDRLAKLAGLKSDFQIIPFRGEYYDVSAPTTDFVHHLIYRFRIPPYRS